MIGKTMIAQHILDAQLLNGNHAETVDDFTSGLVNKVMTSVLSRQCLSERMDSKENLQAQVAAWECQRNKDSIKIDCFRAAIRGFACPAGGGESL